MCHHAMTPGFVALLLIIILLVNGGWGWLKNLLMNTQQDYQTDTTVLSVFLKLQYMQLDRSSHA
uniref:Uncharacterized protein n=1 Tax=Anguilla anguilla TaxID=7936 RepID=A0A0E9VGD0_ANGAN